MALKQSATRYIIERQLAENLILVFYFSQKKDKTEFATKFEGMSLKMLVKPLLYSVFQ